MFIFALEGVTGMIPAMLTDVDFSEMTCDFAKAEGMSAQAFMVLQIFLSTLMPYWFPFLLMLTPLIWLTRRMVVVNEEPNKSTVKNIVIIVWTHIACRY